ncbi:MAG: CoA pyrophosphatase [Bacteroidales bacterium]|nr:CoA pyrophosphatase [Bacteroidales bacterium]
MEQIASDIERAIAGGLPGTDVQWEMASSDRMRMDFPRVRGEDSRLAAVLILLYPADDSIFTFFIQRPNYNGVHGGQISFPGGKAESGDADLIHTALREASEEAGVDPKDVTILGVLTPLFIPVSDTEVTPVVGWCNQRPQFTIDPAEVVHIIEADFLRLNDSSMVREKPFLIRDQMLEVKYYDYDGSVIWGATAMILHELLVIMRRDGILPT